MPAFPTSEEETPKLCAWYQAGNGSTYQGPICGQATHYVIYLTGGGAVSCQYHAIERVGMGQATIAPL